MRRSGRFAVFLLGVALIAAFCQERRSSGKVEVNFRVIRYTESAGQIQLGWDHAPSERPVAYVPSARRWRAEMPEWARHRRDEILPFIQRETRHMNFVWEEYD